jgi:formiminotetrahydrofolate cyclodeaminase
VDAEMREAALDGARLSNALSALVARDAEAYQSVSAAYKLPGEGDDAAAVRKKAVHDALMGAAQVPLETARACAEVARLAALVAAKGNTNAASDAGVAALLADAGCRGAALNVRINVAALEDKAPGAPLLTEVEQLVAQTGRLRDETLEAVERVIVG